MWSNSDQQTEQQKQEAVTESTKVGSPANGHGTSASNPELLRHLYAAMMRCRMLAERTLASSGRADSDPAIGKEAIVVGTTIELGEEDMVAASPRNSAARVAIVGSGKQLVVPQRQEGGMPAGFATEHCPGSAAAFDPFNFGTGLALAHKLEKRHGVVVALCEGASPPAGWHDAIKFAGIHKLPIIYVKSASPFELAPEKRAPALEDVSFMARNCGFPAVIVDANDVVAIWRVAQESIHRARNGAGPTLIECEVQFTQFPDPLAQMEHYLRKRDIWQDEWRQSIVYRIEAEIGKHSNQSNRVRKAKAPLRPDRNRSYSFS